MALAAGQRLSQYQLVGPLGAGGMGQVWRALDTQLGREVAIKVLPDDVADSTESLQRFEREAHALACISHPNLATVYGFGKAEGTRFLAMELVPGEDLAVRLARGPLPSTEALDVCRQIAEGLEAAHDAGVIHRDLKPANVVVTPEGRAKLLDFGLAKPMRAAGAGSTPPVLSTEPGRLLGTPTYMAPEQARGRPLDRRVDVWAFGCVLYECLTGQRAFDGNDLGDVLVAVIEREPDLDRLPAATPPHVRTLLARCLDKNPRTRLRDVGEARVLLERAPEVQARPAPARRAPMLLLGTGVVGAVGIVAWLGGGRRGPPAATQLPLQLQRLTDMAGMEETPALSPDGDTVAFVSRVEGERQIFLRTKGAPQLMTHGSAEHSSPRWVDANTLLYFRHPSADGAPGALQEKIVLSASPPRTVLIEAQGEADVSHDGRRLATFRSDADGPALVFVERVGERRETVRRLPPAAYSTPRWSPDDRSLAFQARIHLARTEIRVMDVESGATRTIADLAQARGLTWLPDGSGLVYSSSQGSTLAYPPVFRLRRLDLEDGRDVLLPLPDAGYASYVDPDIAAGKLVTSRVHLESDIYRYPIDGSPQENTERALRITQQTGLVQVPSVSPDGPELAYLSDSGGHANVWVVRVDGSQSPRKITDEHEPDVIVGLPLWSPRGDLIVYWKARSKEMSAELWLAEPDGSGERFLVAADGGASWSADGEWVYYIGSGSVAAAEPVTYKIRVTGGEPVLVRSDTSGMAVSSDQRTGYFSPSTARQNEVWKVTPIEAGAPVLLASVSPERIPLWPHQYALSPDDRWLAAPLRDKGTTDLWLVSTDDGSLRRVTDFGRRPTLIGRQVSWSSDSAHLFAALMMLDADVVLLEGALP